MSSLLFGVGQSISGSCNGVAGVSSTHFTGRERDNESRVDDYPKRYYASTLGRFRSADPAVMVEHIAGPQSWNLSS